MNDFMKNALMGIMNNKLGIQGGNGMFGGMGGMGGGNPMQMIQQLMSQMGNKPMQMIKNLNPQQYNAYMLQMLSQAHEAHGKQQGTLTSILFGSGLTIEQLAEAINLYKNQINAQNNPNMGFNPNMPLSPR